MGFILSKDTSGNYIELIDWDTTLKESHYGQNVVTQFPIEADRNGSTALNDHSIKQPTKFDLEIGVTNTPINELVFGNRQGSVQPVRLSIERFRLADNIPFIPTASFGIRVAIQEARFLQDPQFFSALLWEPFDAVQAYTEKFIELRENAVLLDVVTETRAYKDVLLTNVSNTNDATTGNAMVFQLGFEAVNIVTTSIVAAPVLPSELRAQEKAQQAAKNPKPSTKGKGAADGTSKGPGKSVAYKLLTRGESKEMSLSNLAKNLGL